MITTGMKRVSRREFLRWSALGAGAFYAGGMGLLGGLHPLCSSERPLPSRPLGKTGKEVSIVGLGGSIAVAGDEETAAHIVEQALDLGITYIDTASQYGPSEANIGRVLSDRRDEAFLASKSDDRSYDGTMRQFEQSLSDLHTDYLDVYQLHGIHDRQTWEDVQRADGALKAVETLRDEGSIGAIGVTSHKNASLLGEILDAYPFDCVLMSMNAGDRHYDSMIKHALPVARERGIGIIAMKIAAYDGRIFRDGGVTSMEEALGYVLSQDISTAIVGISSTDELDENASIARAFTRFDRDALADIEARTADYETEVNFFKHQW